MTSRKSSSSFGARRWLTRGQIADKYRDHILADQICDAKLADEELAQSHTKYHPDCPGNEAGDYAPWMYTFAPAHSTRMANM